MTLSNDADDLDGTVLVVDGDILSRHAIADYLRQCGYRVVEAGGVDEAMTAVGDASLRIDVILCDVAAIGTQAGFELAKWVREHHPALEVRMAGSLAVAASSAADMCEDGPKSRRPYEPQAVIDYIKTLRARRAREGTPSDT